MRSLDAAAAIALAFEATACSGGASGGPADQTSDAGAASDAGTIADAASSDEPIAPPPTFAVRVENGKLVDAAGAPLRLVGVDHSGTEYACVQGNGIFDGDHDAAMVDAIASWRANVVRIPLNEDCWLGLNGVEARFSGAAYESAIVDFVKLLHQKKLYAILDLHWTAPGTSQAVKQQPMADKDHAPDFWRAVATAFKDDPAVVFDLFNEPFLDQTNTKADPWSCWKSGCAVTFDGAYDAAGMQDLVDAVRSTGASQPIMLGGLAYANDLSGWLAHRPSDPQNALVASFHVYNFNGCVDAQCWDAQLKPIAAAAPVVAGEMGEDDCQHTFIDSFMTWGDAAGVSYLGWSWNAWGNPSATSCGSNKIVLVADSAGTPTPYGAGLKTHLATLAP